MPAHRVRRPPGGPVLAFVVARLAVFLAVVGVLAGLGLRGVPLVLAALLLSAVVSYPLLRRQRGEMARRLEDRRG